MERINLSSGSPARGIAHLRPEDLVYPDGDDDCAAESTVHFGCIGHVQTVLEIWFHPEPDVFIAGNLNVYYEQGNPEKVVRPNVMVVFGAPKGDRLTWLPWNEGGRMPNFVLEVTSLPIGQQNLEEKRELYASLGVEEYFRYDPVGEPLDSPFLQGWRLEQDVYQELALETGPDEHPCIFSEVLMLTFCDFRDEQMLRLYDPGTGRYLPTLQETMLAEQHLETVHRRMVERACNPTSDNED